MKNLPTPVELNKMLSYDKNDGTLVWKERPNSMFLSDKKANYWNKRFAGKPAFSYCNGRGYMVGSIWNIRMYAHRVIWAMTYGHWPDGIIDHQDGNKKNNKIENLREASLSQNSMNRRPYRTTTSGFKGVSFNFKANKWYARIYVAGKHIQLGSFSEKMLAYEAYKAASEKHFGEFSRH